ncbi:MAG: 2-amino-4-hydroxy-6-hydroxymethyldihydropteridine diphosphokinase [Bacteroidetes bacterium]|nr:2-amino-4-hydroxy-6-hydroxymethyldihydropteridine diphosphokinase [Bacteroidota bacterium]
MEEVVLSLGSNMGDRAANLCGALLLLEESGLERVAVSRIYETEPWGFRAENSFYNLVAVYRTFLEPAGLMTVIADIETSMGRVRSLGVEGYESRVIDIDILFYGDRVINEGGLVIPHPRLAERRFVLEPLAELMPGKIHPVNSRPVSQMLSECTDELPVKKIQP